MPDDLFKVIHLESEERIGNLDAEAHGVVKGTKYFPIYKVNGKQAIFKPMSKTKPMTTLFFAFAEVFWSHVLKKYFDASVPIYRLAICKGYEKEVPKYYEKGVLVESITPNGEKLINLYDIICQKPLEFSNSEEIREYINYCMTNYDYTQILLSEFISKNKDLGEEIAYQLLLSILRQDQNFHYENINFYQTKSGIEITPPIDFEFSTPFLYPDDEKEYEYYQLKYYSEMVINPKSDITEFLKEIAGSNIPTTKRNICTIVKLFPNVVIKFIENLENFISEFDSVDLSDPDDFIEPLNSNYWLIGDAYFKEKDLDKYEKLKETIKLKQVNKEEIFARIKRDILHYIIFLRGILKMYLISFYKGLLNIEELTLDDFKEIINVSSEITLEMIQDEYKKVVKKLGFEHLLKNKRVD